MYLVFDNSVHKFSFKAAFIAVQHTIYNFRHKFKNFSYHQMFCLIVLFIYIILTNKNTFLNMPKTTHFWLCFELKADLWKLLVYNSLFCSVVMMCH